MNRRFWLGLFATLIVRSAASDVEVFIGLEGPPAAAVVLADSPPAKASPVPAAVGGAATITRRRIAELTAQQAALEPQLQAAGARVIARFTRLANGFGALVPEESLDALRQLPGVAEVVRVRHYERALETSVPFVSAPAAWRRAAGTATGRGMRIGIIDSGIDYLHAAFGGSGDPREFLNNDPDLVEVGSFPTDKVVGGTDFVGDNYNSSSTSPGANIPVPDDDPLDATADGHGTHVASIAAGFGVTTNGTTYAGPFDVPLNAKQFKVGPGVAPEAKLYALKVFGNRGTTSATIVAQALEWALDPDGNGDFSDHLEVVNLSLGGIFESNTSRDPEIAAANLAVQSQIVVVVSAGNSGNIHFVTGSPAVASRAISVANSIDDGATLSTIKVTAPPALVGEYASQEGDFTAKLSAVGPITAPVVYVSPADACKPITNGDALKGKIALIDRGSCFFSDKIRAAQRAGAIGVLMVNNVDGPPILMGGSGDTSDIKIPGVMIRLETGALLKTQLGNGLTVTLAAFAPIAHPELADQLENSSSRGPRMPDAILKPDLAAPGTSIQAASAGSGVDGKLLTGTSMAAPHVSGAAAILRQLHPDWSVVDLKAALMNAAVIPHNERGVPYPESRTGAGRLQVDAAAGLGAVARVDNQTGEVSLSFGALNLASPFTTTRNLRLINQSARDLTFTLSVSNTVTEPGVTLTPLTNRVVVPARDFVLVPVRFDADPSRFDQSPDDTTPTRIGDKPRHHLIEASGEVWFHTDSQALHVPWHSIVNAESNRRLTTTQVGLPPVANLNVPLPSRGTGGHRQPLVALLRLGALSSDRGFSDEKAWTDLLATGAASDFATHGNVAETTVYFGFAVAGRWPTPQRTFVTYDFEIDLNGDNRADYIVMNSTSGSILVDNVSARESMTDALLTVVRDVALTKNFLTAGTPFNVLDPAQRDTKPYYNSAALLGAPATTIGLTANRTAFRYRLIVGDDVSSTETTAWIPFDIAQPLVDATPFGLDHTPWFDEGLAPTIAVNRSAAIAAGFSSANPLRVLALHLHNPPRQQVDLVNLDPDVADLDGDGRNDVDEMTWFGDLTSNGSGDQDGDGMLDGDEVRAGTDPRASGSVFQVLPPEASGGTLRWTSAANRTYAIERANSPSGPYTTLKSGLPATPPLNHFSDTESLAGSHFYRVRIETP